jgi:TetR/AcrR family transcriptional repressor of nem operon
MARYTREHKEQTRKRILDAASRAFRADGVAGVAIPRVMGEAGLTHGGFYAHFESKDALIAEAFTQAAHEARERVLPISEQAAPGEGLRAVIESYVSPRHRDRRAEGCPFPALAGEIAREAPAARHALNVALEGYLERLAGLMPGDFDAEKRYDRALALASGMVGAIMLARAVDDPALSDRLLAACREFSLDTFSPVADAGDR